MGIIYVKHIPTVELVFGVTKSADTTVDPLHLPMDL